MAKKLSQDQKNILDCLKKATIYLKKNETVRVIGQLTLANQLLLHNLDNCTCAELTGYSGK